MAGMKHRTLAATRATHREHAPEVGRRGFHPIKVRLTQGLLTFAAPKHIMEHLFTSESLISFFILVILEIVLGIDNVIFVSIIMNRLPAALHKKARLFWMVSGIIMRSFLLMGLGWLLDQKGKELFGIGGKSFDLASLVMLLGGLFLIYKSVKEIHHKLEGEDPNASTSNKPRLSWGAAIGQIMLIDAVFSFDSIITAGGTAKHVEIMIAAVVIAMIVMFLFSPKIAGFISKHPTLKMLALSFLVMIGLGLVMEGWDPAAAHELHLKNYIYFGMAFSFVVEMLNMTMMSRAKKHVVQLNEPHLPEDQQA
jgi:predicted tellurium resistance membrane protein TerC